MAAPIFISFLLRDHPSHCLMKGGKSPLLGKRFAGSNDDLVGRHFIGALLNTAAAEQAFGHGQVGLSHPALYP